jgi:hypothetical protein
MRRARRKTSTKKKRIISMMIARNRIRITNIQIMKAPAIRRRLPRTTTLAISLNSLHRTLNHQSPQQLRRNKKTSI